MRRAAAILAVVVLLAAGCATRKDVHADVAATNTTSAPVVLLVKVWDHEGVLVFNTTGDLAAGGGATSLGTVSGPAPTYGSRYSWFAQAGNATQQLEHDPAGVTRWCITVLDDGIEFAFATANSQCLVAT